MRSLLSQLLAIGPELAAFILTLPLLGSKGAYAITPALAPSPNLDLSQLGRVAVAGDFDSISVYTYVGQNEDFLVSNGSQALLTQYPNGAFASLALSDATIETMCQFERNGKFEGVVVGGNFTSLGGVKAQSVAFFDPGTDSVTPLPGLNGPVSMVYCDNDAGTVYVGGMFTASHSQNAMAWTTEWKDLPFSGFNGPVNSITKNAAGNIVFGGSFDGLGNTTTKVTPNGQVVNLAGGDISAVGSSSDTGFSDPKNIICKTGQDGPGNTWLLEDHRGGYWQGDYSFGFTPTQLRLYNTKYQGRGTKSFYFENLVDGGILEFTYPDGNGQNQTCSAVCPLPQDNTDAQDFFFTQPIGFASFRLWIKDWYGDGGGLAGIEMFQDDIYSFAVNDFNEPTCDGVSNAAFSTVSPPDGLWIRVANNGSTSSDYLSAYLTDESQATPGTSVVFAPHIEQFGNYSITVYTPGCIADDSCRTRGMVNLTGLMTSEKPPVTATISQTNDFDKYDQIYIGPVDVSSESFSPTVTLAPLANQPLPQTIVAQRVHFELMTTTGGLNGLYEYNPNKATVSTDFSNSAIDSAGQDLGSGALVNTIIWEGDQGYVGGKFSGDGFSNILSISDKAEALPNGGLNAKVQTMYLAGSMLYVGGSFTNTHDNSIEGLQNVAAFDSDNNKWVALGAGVDGSVSNIVPITINITTGDLEDCITVNGDFSSVNAYGGNDAFSAEGFAIWVPSKKNWLKNIPDADITVFGKLFTQTKVTGMEFPLYAGQVVTEVLGFSGAVEMVGSGEPFIQSLGIKIQASDTSSSMRKRAIDPSHNYTGVYTGLFYDDNGLNITVLGGNFAATGSNGDTVQNLAIVKSKGSRQIVSGVSELDSSSIVAAVAFQDTLLFAGGSITGTIDGNDINGLVVYDLEKGKVASPQPPALAGGDVVVNAIAPQQDSSFVYVGGDFAEAGSLPCPTLCYYDTSIKQWNTPGLGLSGTITSMFWTSKTSLIIAGSLTVRGTKTKMATYDSKMQTFAVFPKTASLPGEITALTPADSNFDNFWAAGASTSDGSAFLSLYQDDKWTSVNGLGPSTVIRGLQVLSLTDDHDSTNLVPSDEVLMIVGNINVPHYGNASAVLFNGTGFEPFLLTSKDGDDQGSIAGIFVSNPLALLNMGGNHLAIGFVVLIGLAIALGLIFLIVVVGILMERARRRREGYVPMAAARHNGNLSRIPPETLLGKLGEKVSPPKI